MTVLPNETSRFKFTIETALYMSLALAALAVRLWGLGIQPLTDAESHDALLAFRFVHGQTLPPQAEPAPITTPNSPLLFSLTSLAFLLFGASDTTARLMPALAGGLLVLTPAFYRRDLGRLPALVLAALLAVSPPLIALSRTADGAALVALALMICIGAVDVFGWTGDRRYLFVAAAAGGAVLAGGPRAVTAVLGLALSLGLWRLLDGPGLAEWIARLRSAAGQTLPVGALAAVAGASFLILSSALLLYRSGLAAAAQAIPTWVAGWASAEVGRGWLHLPAVLVVYEPLIVFLGLAGLVGLIRQRQDKHHFSWALVAWSLAALALAVLYPGRVSEDAAWIVIPLAGLAARFVVELLSGDWTEIDAPAVAIHAALVVLLIGYVALNLASYSLAERTFAGSAAANLGLAGVSLVLILLISLLFGVGWSASGAVRGLVVGLSAALLLAGVSSASRLVHWGEGPEMASELWSLGPPVPMSGLRMLQTTLEDVSDRAVGDPTDMAVVVDGPPAGALAWALREFPATYTDALGAAITSPAVIASAEQSTPELGSAYMGQEFAIRGRLEAEGWGPLDWLGWLAFRRRPALTDNVVLWVRSDVQFDAGVVPAQ